MKFDFIQIFTPASYETGGVEALYQLADAINQLGGRAFTVFVEEGVVPERYKHYKLNLTRQIVDVESSLVIVPEVWTDKLYAFSRSQKAIWWLSVDNNHGKFKDFTNSSIIHFTQSLYANFYLHTNGARQVLPLTEYISMTPLPPVEKQDIICYNPAKGLEITQRIQSYCSDICFLPLTKMTKQEIQESLNKSKIYIDFGHHPGCDRLPREAVLHNCVVVVGARGSAQFATDIPIPIQYRLTSFSKNPKDFFIDIFQNYEKIIQNFSPYKKFVLQQKEEMFKLVDRYFL